MTTESALTLFERFLRSQGLKMTWERNLILTTTLGWDGHFQADEMVRLFETSRERISRATVYRTIKLLTEAGILKSFQLKNSIRIYERRSTHHDHMVCVKCGKIIEFFNPGLEGLQAGICRQEEFKANSHLMIIYGECKHCRDMEQRNMTP